MWRGGLTARRLWVLITHLPLESAVQTAIRDDPDVEAPDSGVPRFGPWSQANYQLASLIDAVNRVAYYTVAVTGANPPKPDPTPRPGLLRRISRAAAERLAALHPDRKEP